MGGSFAGVFTWRRYIGHFLNQRTLSLNGEAILCEVYLMIWWVRQSMRPRVHPIRHAGNLILQIQKTPSRVLSLRILQLHRVHLEQAQLVDDVACSRSILASLCVWSRSLPLAVAQGRRSLSTSLRAAAHELFRQASKPSTDLIQ